MATSIDNLSSALEVLQLGDSKSNKDLTLEKFSSTIVSHVQAERKVLTRVIPILLELVR